jgi:hypothetical protein
MARPKNTVPTYRLHSPSGNSRCWVACRWVNLGKYNNEASWVGYARIVAELATSPAPTAPPSALESVSLNALLLAFWKHSEPRRFADERADPVQAEVPADIGVVRPHPC